MFSKQQMWALFIIFMAGAFMLGIAFGILTTVKPPEANAPYLGKFDISDFEMLRAKYGADRYVVDSRTGQFIMIGPESKEIARLDLGGE